MIHSPNYLLVEYPTDLASLHDVSVWKKLEHVSLKRNDYSLTDLWLLETM
jgi:hypothetical protein